MSAVDLVRQAGVVLKRLKLLHCHGGRTTGSFDARAPCFEVPLRK
jgi:hypothetical protein